MSNTDLPVRGPGRPPKPSSGMDVKKGKPVWKPASLNDFIEKEDGYRYRMIRKDPINIAKKQAEGWDIVSGIQSTQTKHVEPDRIQDGKPLTSVQEGHDWVLGRLPEEIGAARDEYINTKTQRRVDGLTAHLKDEIKKGGSNTPLHGKITISSRRGTQEIE